MLAGYVFLTLVGLTVILAVVRGDNEDRAAAACFVLATFLSTLADLMTGPSTLQPEIGVVVTDLILLAALIYFVLRSQRFWPLWATGFHLGAVFTHLAVWIDMDTAPAAYAISLGMWSFPTIGALIVSLILRKSRATAKSPAVR